MDKADLYDVLTAELRSRFARAQSDLREAKATDGEAFALGYHDALGELLEYVEDGEIAATTTEVAS